MKKSSPITWEENPAYQRAQALTIFGLLSVGTIIAGVYGIRTGKYLYLGVAVAVWMGVILSWALLGGAMVLIVTLAAKLSRWRGKT